MWWAAAGLGLNAIGALAAYRGRDEQARQMRAETDEELRRFKLQSAGRVGMARAAGAASGIEFESGSLQNYLSAMTTEFARQADWMKRAGYQRAAAGKSAAGFGLVSDLGSSLFNFGAANNWWK
jgi:hypothetical protein